jgi:GT2 family glycosyltransferase
MKKLSAVIVNYGTADLTKKCVHSLRQWKVVDDPRIFIVDNASPDDSLARLRSALAPIRIIAAPVNGGFSFGVNLGVRETQTPYVLILNPDTYFVDDSIQYALSVLESQPDIGLLGLDLIYPDGRRQFPARRFYSVLDILGRRLPLGRFWPLKARVARHMMLSAWKHNQPFEADWVMGTGFIVRRDLFQRLGGMDESYFLYMEDVDLCARIWISGHRVVSLPNARLVHDHQRASAATPFGKSGRYHLKSLGLFVKKYRLPVFTPPTPRNIKR